MATARVSKHKRSILGTTGMKGKAALAKKFVKQQFKHDIAINEKYHKEEATKWAEDIDWEELKDEFGRKDVNNRFLYKTVADFALIQAKGNEEIERWIRKSIGVSPKKELLWQGDWAMERVLENSKDLEHTQMLKKQMQKDFDLFQVIIPVAGSYHSWRQEPDKLRQLVIDYMGPILEEKPDFKNKAEEAHWEARQEARINKYMHYMEQIEKFKATVDKHYLDALGMNKPNMLQQLFALMLNNPNGDPRSVGRGFDGRAPQLNSENGKEHNAAGVMAVMLTQMEQSRSKIFDTPLPDEYEELVSGKGNIIDVKPTNGNGHGKHKVKN